MKRWQGIGRKSWFGRAMEKGRKKVCFQTTQLTATSKGIKDGKTKNP